MIKQAFARLFGVFTAKQTFLNLAYLLASSVCALIDFMLFSVSAALILGLVAVPMWVVGAVSLDLTQTAKAAAVAVAGVLTIPASVLSWYVPALVEQRLAGWLLYLHFSVHAFWTGEAGILTALLKYIASGVAWRRFLFGVLRIPLGALFFLAVLVVVPAAVAMLSMPAVFLAGYRDLIVWTLRIDSLGETLAVFLAALILAPLALHAFNWLTRVSAGLAKLCLQD